MSSQSLSKVTKGLEEDEIKLSALKKVSTDDTNSSPQSVDEVN